LPFMGSKKITKITGLVLMIMMNLSHARLVKSPAMGVRRTI